MFIRSERLFLRPGWAEDWAELFSRNDDWTIIGHIMTMAHAAAQRPDQGGSETPLPRFPHFVITLPGSDGARPIGCASLLRDADGCQLVYWLAPDEDGLGYEDEAVRAVTDLAGTLGHSGITTRDLTRAGPASVVAIPDMGVSAGACRVA